MADGSDLPDTDDDAQTAPVGVRTHDQKVKFALSRHYGMGRDGERWSRERIADALGVSKRQVSRYLNESDIAQDVKDVLAVDEAAWRLDMAVDLRKEIQRLEDIERQLLKRKKAVPTGFETKSVRGSPTGDYNVKLADDTRDYQLQISVPTRYTEVTAYGRDLKEVQTQKRQYWDQVADLLGLDAPSRKEVDHTLADRTEEVKVIEFRTDDDEYPSAQAEATADGDIIDIDNVAHTVRDGPDDDASDEAPSEDEADE